MEGDDSDNVVKQIPVHAFRVEKIGLNFCVVSEWVFTNRSWESVNQSLWVHGLSLDCWIRICKGEWGIGILSNDSTIFAEKHDAYRIAESDSTILLALLKLEVFSLARPNKEIYLGGWAAGLELLVRNDVAYTLVS